MRVVGFNFTKISIEKLKENTGNLKFNTKIDISSIESLKSDFFKTKEDLIKINFAYSILYEPDLAKLDFTGNLIISVESKIAKNILKEWEDKKIPQEFRFFVLNVILRKTNIKALQLEDELNLPSHIPLPFINKENSKKEETN